jgi:FkbM family methyltransferase
MRLRKSIKSVAYSFLGERRARRIKHWIRGDPKGISETDLVYDYFCMRGTIGLMVDVGAHIGGTLLPFLRARWNVLAFEPDPTNRKALEILQKEHARLKIFSCAVAERDARDVPFYASEESTGISSLSAFHHSHREIARVNITTLAQIASSERLQRIDFLKIDTEGHDFFVLRGCPWDRIKPEVIVCEFEDLKSKPLGYTYADLGNYLVDRGYTVFMSEWEPIVRYGATHRWKAWKPFPASLECSEAWGNFVAFSGVPDAHQLNTLLRQFGASI